MRKTIPIVLALITVATQPAAAIFEVGADGGYISQSFTYVATSSSGTTQTSAKDYAGYTLGGYGHFTFGLPNVLTVGVGPQLAFSGQSIKSLETGYTSQTLSFVRFGLDLKLQAEALPVVKPFVRIAFGKDSGTWTFEGPYSGQTRIDKYSVGGLYYNALVGIQFSIAPILSLYIQGGLTGGGKSSGKLESITLNGKDQSFIQLGTVEVSYSGYMINAGASLAF